jgi:hypothetical protein
MHRRIIAIGCAALLGLSLAACDPKDAENLGAAVNGGLVSPTLSPGDLTPENLKAAGFTNAQVAKVMGYVQQGTAAAKGLGSVVCPVLPLGETLANVFMAEAATSSTGVTVKAALNFACAKLAAAPTYTGFAHRRGERVKIIVHMGRYDVPLYGVRR